MRLIFHGILRDRFGPDVVMVADTVASALEGFSRQVDWPTEIMVDVVGFDTEAKLKTYADEVHVMPAMLGGGGKWGSIILGTVLVGVGLLVGGPVGLALIVNGGLMVLQGVISMFLKSPTIKGVDDPEASKYLAVNRNTTAIGTPITMAWGTIDLAGHWLSLQSDSTNLSFGMFPANPT